MKKIGIMGGTFNPIHLGHIELGKCAYEQYNLDKVIYMPAFSPGHRIGENISSFEHRANMVKLAIKDYPYFEFSDLEYQRGGYTYTVDTLRILQEIYRDAEIYFIIGADSLFNFHTWKEPENIVKMAHLLVSTRDDVDYDELTDKIEELSDTYNASIMPLRSINMPISSTMIRNAFAFNEEPDYIDENVRQYAHLHKLYSIDIRAIDEYLQEHLDKKRYEHSISVAFIAKALAKHYGANDFKAYLAGLVHDIAKCMPDDEKLKICHENGIEISKAELNFKELLHPKVGAYICREIFGINDKDFLNAIIYHTTGRANMSLLEKIIYIADYIEPSRKPLPNIERLRELAYEDIDKTVYQVSENIIKYLEANTDNIDEASYQTRDYYKQLFKETEELQ
ncbi:MAG: nicotinate (nicotinamide) nucleotide adenylyltransferase [Lachnospira sp.]|nr:nicotinate (nicotinamide) nucleotide adenylyltransferase [Lachnospira sp.]